MRTLHEAINPATTKYPYQEGSSYVKYFLQGRYKKKIKSNVIRKELLIIVLKYLSYENNEVLGNMKKYFPSGLKGKC